MLVESIGDLWSYVPTHRIIITTNTYGVMGAGLALQAKKRYSGIQESYQAWLATCDDKTDPWYNDNFPDVILAPTKIFWKDSSPLALIESTLKKLSKIQGGPFAISELGCGLGGRKWEQVKDFYSVLIPVPAEWTVVHPPKMRTGILR